MREPTAGPDDDSASGGGPEQDVWLTGTIQIGTYEGYRVSAGPSRDPRDARAPEHFGVNVFVPDQHGRDVDIVRVDTAHAGCHVDRLYLPEDHPCRRDYSLTFFSPEEVLDWLLDGERWLDMVKAYDETHGLPPRAWDEFAEE